jgi:hypothetical protein
LILREEHKLRVFENRVLRRICGPRRDGVTGGWRKLRKEERHNLCSSPSIIRMVRSTRMRLARNVARMRRRGMQICYWWDIGMEDTSRKAKMLAGGGLSINFVGLSIESSGGLL